MKTPGIDNLINRGILAALLLLPLNLRATPTIETPPTNTPVAVGSNVTFSVVATGAAPLTYRWQINGVGNFGSGSTLTLTNVSLSSDGDLITVIVTDGLHQSITNDPPARLTVLNPPSIVVEPQSLVVAAGGDALFQVSVNGGLPFSYQWQKNGTNLTGSMDNFLDLIPVADSDAAVYTVIVSNSDGSVLSAQAYLTVIEPELVASQPLAAPVNTCTNITLSVITNGTDTNLSFQWFFGTDLAPIGSNSPSLTIAEVEAANAGLYTVQVSTFNGSADIATGTLLVTNPPPVIINGPADVTVATGPGNTTCAQVATWIPPTVLDNCPGAILSADHNPGEAFPVGTNLVTYTATDSGGLTAHYSFHVIVQDTTPPVAVFNAVPVQLDATGNYTLTAADVAAIANGSSDACSGVSNSVAPQTFSFCDAGSKPVTLTVTDASGNQTTTNGSITVLAPVAPPTVVYVDASYSGCGPVTFPNTGGTGAYYVGYNAFATIQAGINAVAANGTVRVAAGQYVEEISISQPLSLLGPNAANNPNLGPRVPEAVLLPDASNPEFPGGVVQVNVAASDVVIAGFTIDGFNPVLGGGVTAGADSFNAAVGIGDYNSDSGIRVENNIVKNDAYAGVDFESGTGNPPTNNLIANNLVMNIDYNTEGFGIGIVLYNNNYADIVGNCLSNVAVGISPQWFYLPNPGSPQGQFVRSNNVSASLLGIWLNLIYSSASTFEISDNTSVYAPTNGSALWSPPEWDGIEITSIQSDAGVRVNGNTITGPGTNVGYYTVGYNIWNTPTTNDVLIQGGAISNVNYGVWVNNYDGYLSPGDSANATVSGVTIDTASLAGVYVQDDPLASTNGVLVRATVTGNTVITNSALGVWVQGTRAGATVLSNASSITGDGIGILVDAGDALLQGNNLTGNTVAAIMATNGAVVDAGNCTGANVTGLGISTGGNDLSGYGFDAVAPWAILNANVGGNPLVLADHDNFGAVLGDNIPAAFSGAVDYAQSPAVLGAPADLSRECASDVPAGATNLVQLAAQGGYYSGNSSNAVVTFLDDTNLTASGVLHRTYTITDGCGTPSVAVQTITVSDTNAPVFTVIPGDVVYNTDSGQCSKSNVTWIVNATDNCHLASLVSIPVSGSTFLKGTTTVTNIATDTSSNQTVTTFTVTIVDREPPAIVTGARDATINADATAHASLPDLTGEVIASDNCGSVTNVQIPAAGTVVGLGPHSVTVWAIDSSLNSNSSSATITVIDATAPALTIPPDVTINLLQPKDPYFTGTATATDAGADQQGGSNTISYTDSASLTNCDSTGQILRTWYAVDPSNNTNSGTQTITVIDDVTPLFTFVPDNITTTNDPGQCSAVVNYHPVVARDPGYFDGFEDSNFVSGLVDQYQSYSWNDYNSHVTRVASGFGGIAANGGSAYGLIDSTVPAAIDTYSGAFSRLGRGNTPFGSGYRVAQDVYLNFDDLAIVNATPTTGYAWDLDTSTRTFDGSSGGYGRDYIFHVAAYGPGQVVIGADNNSADAPDPRRNDLLTLPTHGVLTQSGWYTFEWNFRSTNGVLAADLRVKDTNQTVLFAQTLSDPADLVTNISGNPLYLWFNFLGVDTLPIDNTAYERIVPVNSVLASGSAFPVGTTIVTNIATDACGNASNTTFSVTVNDVEPPSAIVPANMVQTNDPGQCGAVVIFSLPAQSDNCGVASTNAMPPSGSFFPVGTNTVTLVVADIHGNSATNFFNVTVNDVEPPTANVPANITQNNDPAQCGAIVTFNLPAQSDNCGVAGASATPPSGSFFPVGSTPVTVVVADIHDNRATNTFNVTVRDVEPPVITPPADIVRAVDPGQTYAVVTFSPDVSDNCAVSNVVATPPSGSQFSIGTNTVTLVAVDTHGNYATNSFTVQVVGLPVITGQPAGRTNNAGTTAAFTVAATSPTPLTYQWLKDHATLADGGNVSGATNSTLTLADVQDADVASYSVIVGNMAGTVTSSNASLTVIDPPVITSQPAGVSTNATTTATFAVSVNGTAPFGYQWYKNGSNALVDGGNISGALANVLTLSNVLAADRGLYSVVVTNPAGSVTSSNATLIVADPWITAQPSSVTQPLGGSASFAVSAAGTAPLLYMWRQNGLAIPIATNSTYAVPTIRDSDSGGYDVIVSSAGGSVTSSVVTLTVTHPPVFVLSPRSQTVIAGQNVTFNATVNGTTPFGYQWQKNLANIGGATNHSITLTNVTTNDAGSYRVVVTNVDGSATSAAATLQVVVPPSIVSQPAGLTNDAGSTASFSVGVDGNFLAFQWFKNGTNQLADGGNISGTTNSTLVLSNVLGADAGAYSVLITNLGGAVTSSNAVLSVNDPVIQVQPASLSAVLGNPASFTVGVAGTSPAYQWRKNGTPISGANASVYAIASVTNADGADYDVVITNIYGSVTSSPPASLTVLVPALVIGQPAGLTNIAGTTAIFHITASGTGPLGYQWNKNGGSLVDGGNLSGSLTDTLTIVAVSDLDAAGYSVTVTNAYGTNTSLPVPLVVLDPPVIVSQPAAATNNAGTTATFLVVANGTAPMSYQWRKGAAPLTNGENISGANLAMLTIASVSDGDMGDYSVTITNAAGSTNSAAAALTVIDPPVIASQPVSRTNNAGTSAMFSVSVNGTAPFAYQWKKGTADLVDGGNISGATNATLLISGVQDADTGSYSVSISNPAAATNSVAATLAVVDPPIITVGPASVTNNAGTTAVFSVTVNGTAPFAYHWFKNGTNQLDDTGNVTGSATGVLVLSNVLGADRGEYSVVVTNAAGTATSTNAVLGVVDPYIAIQPTNTKAIDGSTASFSVTVVGTAPLSYRWRMDDFELSDGFGISGSGTATLVISNVADSDAGDYSVVITNAAGEAMSDQAELTTVPSLIVFEPTNLFVLEGQPFSLAVGVNGTLPFAYQWFQDGSNVIGATNRVHFVPSATLADAGMYWVEVSNPDGAQTSRSAHVIVYTSPGSALYLLSRDSGDMTVRLEGVPGYNYALQASTNLSDTNWVTIITNASPFEFTDTNVQARKFYRGLYLP